MKILILNWRDIKNPSSGGAEVLTHELASRWVAKGHSVTLFSSKFHQSKREEITDGIRIIRCGNPDARHLFNSVHFLAFWCYMRHWKGKFDVIIDEAHGIPFFTPWYAKEKKVILICEVADTLWKKIFGPFFGILGWLTEKLYLRFIYKNVPVMTISQSTKKDLIANGVKEENITVLPMGISIPKKPITVKREKDPTIIFVGRLIKAKGIEDTLIAVKKLLTSITNVKLWIVGRGDDRYIEFLRRKIKEMDLEETVTFFGFVGEEKKFELMGRAHVLVHPSMREGFGLTIPEAGFMETPAVAYNAAGIRDVIKNEVNGILIEENSPLYLAAGVKIMLENKSRWKEYTKAAKMEAQQYNWDKSANVALSLLSKI